MNAELEAKEVAEDIEMAAGILVEDPSATAEALARNIHVSYAAYAVEILTTRIAKRAEEMKEHLDAETARLARDIEDRAQLVAKGEQLIGDAAEAVAVGFPGRDPNAVLEQLGARVKQLMGIGDADLAT